MNINELKEYNRLVIEASRECCRPWKWTTLILAFLLAGMLCLYFLNPVEFDLDQLNNNSPEAININE